MDKSLQHGLYLIVLPDCSMSFVIIFTDISSKKEQSGIMTNKAMLRFLNRSADQARLRDISRFNERAL